jgi:hypothetical protein
MLLNEMYTPQQVDLTLLSLLVIGNGMVTFATIKGNNNLTDSAKRLLNKGLIQVDSGSYRLTTAGIAVSKNNGLYDASGRNPSKVAHQFAHSQSGEAQHQGDQ